MQILFGVLACTCIGAGLAGLVIALIALFGREYDRHPWFARFLDNQARMAGYVPPADDDITPEYLSQIPGWDERP